MRIALRLSLAGVIAALIWVVFTGVKSDIPIEELKESYTYPESGFYRLMGVDVHYRITGAGEETVVLLHGTSSSLHTWEGWTELLDPHFRVVSLDLPAFGLTGPFPDGDYSPENYLVFLEEFMAMLQLDNFHLAGNSFGGYLAWRYAVRNPEQVQRLVLLNSSGYPRGDQPTPLGFRLAMVEPFRPVFTRFTPRWLVKGTVHEVFYDTDRVTDALVDRYHSLLLREGNRGALMSRIQQVHHETADEVVNVQCPTLILWGDHDRVVTPDDAPKFHRDIPDSRLIVYDRMGHVPMEEDPQRTMADVLPFLNEEIR